MEAQQSQYLTTRFKNLVFFAFLILGLIYISSPKQVSAAFAGGSGTSTSPYQITTCVQLQEAGSFVTSSYVLLNDIDCSDTINWNGGAGFMPIGTSSANRYAGNFNGNGHQVTGLFINRPATNGIGLFGYTATTANIYRVGVAGATFTGAASVGGLVGSNTGTTTESYAIADITTTVNNAGGSAAGLMGDSTGNVSNCYARGTVNGGPNSFLSGLISYSVAPSIITNCFSASVVNRVNGNGSIASSNGVTNNVFWDMNVSGQVSSAGGAVGTTTTAMNTAATFSSWGLSTSTIWALNSNYNNGYPYLLNNNSGPDVVRQIATVADLQNMSQHPGDRYLQTANIDASTTVAWNGGQGFIPIGIFYGKYDGNNFMITNLTSNSSTRDYVGVFGQNRGTITNFRIADSSFTGQNYVGAVAGYNLGTISQSRSFRLKDSSNQVIGSSYAGGFVGQNNANSSIIQSFAIANVSTTFNNSAAAVAGFVGVNFGVISDCYSRGVVSGGANAGISSFVANNNSPAVITNSFSSSIVSNTAGTGFIFSSSAVNPANSFFDLNVVGKNSSWGVGTTTVALNNAATFSAWNLSTIWNIDPNRNNGYPYLRNNDPGADRVIEIATAADLQNIALNPGLNFLQTADIDASTTATWNAGAGFKPIALFYGKYEGNGFVISNLTINRPAEDYVGIFGENRGTLNNFKIYNSRITGSTYTGGVVGYNRGTLYRTKIYRDNILYSYVTGYAYVGGLVGYNTTGAVLSQSYAIANVSTTLNTGGAFTGGLAGYNSGFVFNCYARGTVTGGNGANIAGFISSNIAPAVVNNSFAANVINGNSGTAFINSASAFPVNSFYDSSISGKSDSWATGTSTAKMKTQATFTNVGWDFASGNVWHMDPLGLKDDGYPYLNPPILPAIEVWTVTDLQNISVSPDSSYIQKANIDATASASWNSGAGFVPIVNFTGNYDGNGFYINNLTINRPTEDYVGVFAQNRGTINNFKISDSSFTGKINVGSIAGFNQGTIYRSQSYRLNNSSNQVTGLYNVGGLVGYNNTVGVISQSYAISNVNTTLNSNGAYTGGLAGYNAGTVANCYARGSVTGGSSSAIAGLIGANISPASVSNSFAASIINGASGAGLIDTQSALPINSFWDLTVSTKPGSSGGTGVSTASMQTQSTFTGVGWDFSTIWGMQPAENSNYPYLLATAPSYFSLIITHVNGAVTVDGSPYTVPLSYASGTSVALVATPSSGFSFTNWENAMTSTNRSLLIDSNKTIVATFDIANYTLSYTAGNNGSIIGSSTQVVSYGATGTVVTASSSIGHYFANWSDGYLNATRTDANVTSSLSVTANFATNTYTFIYMAGANGLLVGSSTQTVEYGSSSSAVTAVANSGYRFVKWSDDSIDNPRSDTATASDLTVTAIFELIPVVSGGGGIIVSMPAGVGSGASDVAATAVGGTLNVGQISTAGTNVLTYINTFNNFTIISSSHPGEVGSYSFQIINFDLNTLVIAFRVSSVVQTATLKKGEKLNLDLDGDKINDINFTFVGNYSNRVEITVRSLIALDSVSVDFPGVVSATGGTIAKINNSNRPAVYYISDGLRYLFVNRDTYSSWSGVVGDAGNRFATLKYLTQAEFDATPVGGNLTVKPGNLIKFDDSAIIYAVGVDKKLYQLVDAAAKVALYGAVNPYIIQSGFRVDYFDFGKPVDILTATSSKPDGGQAKATVTATTRTNKFIFTKDLVTGMINNDVLQLQRYLNSNGFILAKAGAGSPGQETTKFGAATRVALINFQVANNIIPANGSFGLTTRSVINK